MIVRETVVFFFSELNKAIYPQRKISRGRTGDDCKVTEERTQKRKKPAKREFGKRFSVIQY